MATMPEEGTIKQQILEARARALAEKPDVEEQVAVYDTVVVVTVGEEKIAIPAGCLRAIGECTSVTPVFGTPSWLAGITHLRGELLSVVHLAHWLGQPHRRQGPRLAIVEGLEGALGLLIDEVIGFREVLESDLSTALSPNAATQRFTRAITRDLVTILDVGQLLSSAEIIVDQSATVVAPST
jgi:purine-binding chemotaxis protein CheW